MTQAELTAEIRGGARGRYFFYGREEYLKRFYIGRIRHAVLGDDETLAAFNHYKLQIPGTDTGELDTALAAVPVMAERVLVEIHADLTKIKDSAELAQRLSAADAETVTVLLIASPDGFEAGQPEKNKPSADYKIYSAALNTVAFEAQSAAELKKWMQRRLSLDGIVISPAAAEALTNRCGRDMYRLSGELDKLAAAALSRAETEITDAAVAEITCSVDEEDAFALANAVLDGDRRRALAELDGYKKRQEKAPAVLSRVSRVISDMLAVSLLVGQGAEKKEIASKLKMHEYKTGLYIAAVRDTESARLLAALGRCREADIAMKSTRLDYTALERLICTIPARGGVRRR